MAAGCTDLDRENEHTDTYPLLMDNSSLSTNQDHIVSITTGRVTPGVRVEREELCYNSSSAALSSSNEQGEVAISVDSLPRSFSTPVASHMRTTPVNESLGRSGSFGRNTDTIGYGIRSRTSPLNSGLWILIELIVTMSQIIASIIVLSLSRDEKPRAPLSVWVIGYAAGCLATLPLLYWRYSCRRLQQAEQDSIALSGGLPSSPPSSPGTSLSGRMPTAQDEAADGGISSVRGTENSHHGDLRMRVFMDRFKIALDCFFAVWFVVGNVWVFGGHSSSREAPNLYRLCIVFLTFSCIGYAMPFILCATICCCLPCIITLLGLREQQGQAKGASPEVIEALPTYKFKAKVGNGGKGVKDGNDSDSEFSGEGGFVAAGTEKERAVSAEDAVCCICLGKYKDGVELKELPCTHFFHVDCVDKWLKINASCPLCKHEINGLGNPSEPSLTNAGEQS